jgi:DNA-binding CsgD family transcriptional regulator/PAS domain-containing protein
MLLQNITLLGDAQFSNLVDTRFIVGMGGTMQGLEADIFSSVVADIYDCALHPEGWNTVLTRISDLMNAAYATISLADSHQFHAVMAAHSPWDSVLLQALNDDYGIEGVPGLKEVVFGEVDTTNSTMNQMSEAEFQQSRFYQNWVKPQALRDACVTKFVQTQNRLGLVGVITRANRAIINAEERRFMQLLSPHFRRAALIGDLLEQTRVSTQLYQRTLDALQAPVVLTDRTGRLIFANSRAEEVMGRAEAVTLTSGVVSCVTPIGASALQDAINRASQNDLSLGSRGIGIPVSSKPQQPMVAYVLPLTQGTLRGDYDDAAVAIFLSSGSNAALPPESTLIALFDLTPSEARVLLRIGGALTISQTAVELLLSENTVKTHLARIFTKTGKSRQSELVQMVSALRL